MGARQTFFQDIRTLTRYFVFASWDQLLAFMIQQLELKPAPKYELGVMFIMRIAERRWPYAIIRPYVRSDRPLNGTCYVGE